MTWQKLLLYLLPFTKGQQRQYCTTTLQRPRNIVGDAGFQAAEVWCAANEPPHLHQTTSPTMSHHISTKRQSQQCATIFFSQWANTSPPMGQHIANYDPPYFSPHEPPNLRLLSHHIFDYWATIQYLQPKMSHPISNLTRASTSSIICHHIFSTHLA